MLYFSCISPQILDTLFVRFLTFIVYAAKGSKVDCEPNECLINLLPGNVKLIYNGVQVYIHFTISDFLGDFNSFLQEKVIDIEEAFSEVLNSDVTCSSDQEVVINPVELIESIFGVDKIAGVYMCSIKIEVCNAVQFSNVGNFEDTFKNITNGLKEKIENLIPSVQNGMPSAPTVSSTRLMTSLLSKSQQFSSTPSSTPSISNTNAPSESFTSAPSNSSSTSPSNFSPTAVPTSLKERFTKNFFKDDWVVQLPLPHLFWGLWKMVQRLPILRGLVTKSNSLARSQMAKFLYSENPELGKTSTFLLTSRMIHIGGRSTFVSVFAEINPKLGLLFGKKKGKYHVALRLGPMLNFHLKLTPSTHVISSNAKTAIEPYESCAGRDYKKKKCDQIKKNTKWQSDNAFEGVNLLCHMEFIESTREAAFAVLDLLDDTLMKENLKDIQGAFVTDKLKDTLLALKKGTFNLYKESCLEYRHDSNSQFRLAFARAQIMQEKIAALFSDFFYIHYAEVLSPPTAKCSDTVRYPSSDASDDDKHTFNSLCQCDYMLSTYQWVKNKSVFINNMKNIRNNFEKQIISKYKSVIEYDKFIRSKILDPRVTKISRSGSGGRDEMVFRAKNQYKRFSDGYKEGKDLAEQAMHMRIDMEDFIIHITDLATDEKLNTQREWREFVRNKYIIWELPCARNTPVGPFNFENTWNIQPFGYNRVLSIILFIKALQEIISRNWQFNPYTYNYMGGLDMEVHYNSNSLFRDYIIKRKEMYVSFKMGGEYGRSVEESIMLAMPMLAFRVLWLNRRKAKEVISKKKDDKHKSKGATSITFPAGSPGIP